MQGESKKSSFVSDMTQGNEELGAIRWLYFLARPQGCKNSPRIFREMLDERMCFGKRCRCVRNLWLQADLR